MLKSVDNDVRRDKNGVKFNKNCYLTFAAIDAEDGNKLLHKVLSAILI
jgi:hypothetical protein